MQTGVITPQTRVWTRSLKRWAPAQETTLDGLFKRSSAATQTPPPPPPAMGQVSPPPVPAAATTTSTVSSTETGSTPPEGFRSPQLLGHCITILIVTLTLLAGVKIWFEYQQIQLLERLPQPALEINGPLLTSESWHFLLSISWLATYAVTIVFFCFWIYRLARNVRALSGRRLSFSAGLAVGYYFIPILSLWKPYQAMKEIWKGSANPQGRRSTRASPLVGWWWTFWILTSAFNYFVARFTLHIDSHPSVFLRQVDIISDVSRLPLNIIAICWCSSSLRCNGSPQCNGARLPRTCKNSTAPPVARGDVPRLGRVRALRAARRGRRGCARGNADAL